MYSKFRSLGIVVCGVAVAAGLATSPADAARSCKAGRPEKEAKSSSYVMSKTLAAAIKTSDGCHRSRNAGKTDAGIDCSDLSPSQADGGGGFAKAVAKLTNTMAKLDSDPDVPPPTEMGSNYTSCPEPCRTSTSVSEPLTSYAQVGQCFTCLIKQFVDVRSDEMHGTPSTSLDALAQNCDAAISKGYGKRASTAMKGRIKCQLAQDSEGQCLLQPCDTDDTTGKIGNAQLKAQSLLDSACGTVPLTSLDSCADTNLTDLKLCLLAADNATILDAFTAGFLLQP